MPRPDAMTEQQRDPEGSADRPGYLNFRIYVDDSGIHAKAKHYGFGSLWMSSERRGDFSADVDALRQKFRYRDEIKWKTIDAKNEKFFAALVDMFFRTPSLMFHCLVVRKTYVDRSLHGEDPMDTARRKHFSKLLESKVKWLREPGKRKAYHVITDRLPSRYAKADEAAENVLHHTLKRLHGDSIITKVTTQDSKTSAGIQLADVLTGAVLSEWNKEPSGEPKSRMRKHLAKYLGWPDLDADTFLNEWKFNIWNFYDPSYGTPRDKKTRTVKYLVPTPAFRRR